MIATARRHVQPSWRSDEALKIYARINDNDYADNIAAASTANVSSIRTTTISEIMQRVGLVDGQQHAAFFDAWTRSAAAADVATVNVTACPIHCEDDLFMQIQASSKELAIMAAGEDEE